MKIQIRCFQCSEDLLSDPASFGAEVPPLLEFLELEGDRTARGACARGHTVTIVLQAGLYEVLFDSGCLALGDGYYREAIASFASSLERFYEFAIRVMCRHAGMQADLNEVWRRIAAQSERQLGGYELTHLLCFHCAAPTREPRMTQLRNEIVHKGRLATKAEALDYGEHVYNHVMAVTRKLRGDCSAAFLGELAHDASARIEALRDSGARTATYATGTSPVSPIVERATLPLFSASLDSFLEFNRYR